jgi:hypothetical protein
VDKDTISDWFNSWLELHFIANNGMETEERKNFAEPANGLNDGLGVSTKPGDGGD